MPESHADTLGGRLAIALKGKNRKQIAERLGCTDGAIYTWIRGDSQPSAGNLASLARECGVSADWLLCLVDDPTPIPGRRAMVVDECLVAAVLGDEPMDHDTVRGFLSMEPRVLNGIEFLPENSRVVTAQEGQKLIDRICDAIAAEFPDLIDEWHRRNSRVLKGKAPPGEE